MRQHIWPDNVRGLRNYIERSVALADTRLRVLGTQQLPPLDGTRLSASSSEPTDVPTHDLDELTRALTDRGRHN
jgi:transcriptional regulator with PAS, ATPase and Fis domain